MKQIFILIIIFILNSKNVNSQNKIDAEIIKDIAIEISSVNPILESEFKFLDSLLKGKRIVFLGEETHWDGTTLKAKSEIIEYLHKNLGYEVLLLEFNLFDVRKAWLEIKEKRDSSTRVFSYLTKTFGTHISENQKELYRYIGKNANSESPLEIGGVDIFNCSIYANAFKEDLEYLLREIYPNFDKSEVKKHWKIVFKLKKKDNRGNLILDKFIFSCNFLIQLLEEYQNKESDEYLKRKYQFMAQALQTKMNVLDWENNKPKMKIKRGSVLADHYTLRDKYMAENLLWYIEEFYPNKKIIVSASSYHTGRNFEQISPRPKLLGKDAIPMGQFVWDKYNEDIYSIAFVCHHGETGEVKSKNDLLYSAVVQRKKRSLEGIMNSLGFKFGFIDFSKNRNILNEFYLWPTFDKSYKTSWSEIYDGVFYIDEMNTDNLYYLKGSSVNDDQPYQLYKSSKNKTKFGTQQSAKRQ